MDIQNKSPEQLAIECYFTPTKNTTSATICANCGKEKIIHTIGEGVKASRMIIISNYITPQQPITKPLFQTSKK